MRFLALLLSFHLFVVGLLPGADAHELLAGRVLWEHQQAEHPESGFWDFLFDHYLADHGRAAEHRALPFHHAHDCGAQVADLPLPVRPWEPVVPEGAPTRKPVAGRVAGQPTDVARSWWQPPRA